MHIPSGTVFKRFIGDTGGSGNDFIIGPSAEFDTYHPAAWADYSIDGMGGNDTLVGGYGDDEVFGGFGNDTIAGNYGINDLFGEEGIDTLDYSRFGLNSDYEPAYLGVVVDMVNGEAYNRDVNLFFDDLFSGFENVSGSAFNDRIYGDYQANDLLGGGGSDLIAGNGGADYIVGGTGWDSLYGGTGYDDLFGGSGNDYMAGGNGDDLLSGNAGVDTINGGLGADYVYGGLGADYFVFSNIVDSTVDTYGRDTISDFQDDIDTIDLRTIDAMTDEFGNNAFDFISNGLFSGLSGELRYRLGANGANFTVIEGDTNGNGISDFAITVSGRHHFIADDFLL